MPKGMGYGYGYSGDMKKPKSNKAYAPKGGGKSKVMTPVNPVPVKK